MNNLVFSEGLLVIVAMFNKWIVAIINTHNVGTMHFCSPTLFFCLIRAFGVAEAEVPLLRSYGKSCIYCSSPGMLQICIILSIVPLFLLVFQISYWNDGLPFECLSHLMGWCSIKLELLPFELSKQILWNNTENQIYKYGNKVPEKYSNYAVISIP